MAARNFGIRIAQRLPSLPEAISRQYGNKASGQGKKGIPEKDNLMDRMNASELAANQFRMTRTRTS
jgi:hypothetical protein